MIANSKKVLSSLLLGLAIVSPSALAIPQLSFIINGNTFTQPFRIDNTSTEGEFVTRFQLDLSTITSGTFCFDTSPATNGVCNGSGNVGVPLTSRSSTNFLTGLVGSDAANNPVDGATLLDLAFSDFGAGEFYIWDIDVDEVGNINDQTVDGNELIGATALVDFSDGQRLTGFLGTLAGNPLASVFTVTGIAPTPTPAPLSLGLVLLGLGALRLRRS